jgi:hypothetical protein
MSRTTAVSVASEDGKEDIVQRLETIKAQAGIPVLAWAAPRSP